MITFEHEACGNDALITRVHACQENISEGYMHRYNEKEIMVLSEAASILESNLGDFSIFFLVFLSNTLTS